MKRSAPVASDFKRRKAKVGKRAPQAPNYTDTSFRTASVAVRSQDSALEKSSSLKKVGDTASSSAKEDIVSSRGRTLDGLLIQLSRHHAPAARASALRGLRDAISNVEESVKHNVITSNLSVLLPPLFKCLVDQDQSVRSLGLCILEQVFTNLSMRGSDEGVTDDAVIQPFLPLHVAYMSSAFNSLDLSVRLDAAVAVELTASRFTRLMMNHVDSLLSSYERLLESVSGGGGCSENQRKASAKKRRQRKRDRGKDASKPSKVGQLAGEKILNRCSVLRSLATLLRCVDSQADRKGHFINNQSESGSEDGIARVRESLDVITPQPNLTFVRGGWRSNAIFIGRGSGTSPNVGDLTRLTASTPLVSLEYLGLAMKDCNNDKGYGSVCSRIKQSSLGVTLPTTGKTAKISMLSCIGLLEALRDAWVEVMQRGTKHGKGILLHRYYLDEASLLLSSMAQFWRLYCRDLLIAQRRCMTKTTAREFSRGGAMSKNGSSDIAKLIKVTESVHKLVLEALPVTNESWDLSNVSGYDHLNASICCLLGEIGETLRPVDTNDRTLVSSSAVPWRDQVFAYLFSQLRAGPTESDERRKASQDNEAVIEVVKLLLLKSSTTTGTGLLSDTTSRNSLLVKFGAEFFPDTSAGANDNCAFVGKTSSFAVPSSKMKRSALVLACDLIMEQGDSILDFDDEASRELIRIACCFPSILAVLGSNHPVESSRIINTLLFVTRKWNGDDGVACDAGRFFDKLRHELTRIFKSQLKKRSRKKRKDMVVGGNDETDEANSIFESLPGAVQRLALGLVGALLAPGKDTTIGLSQVCARATSNIAPQFNSRVIAPRIVTYIFDVMHWIRKSVSFEDYTVFLINSSLLGARKDGDKTNRNEPDTSKLDMVSMASAICEREMSTEGICRAIVNTGSHRILPLIINVLICHLTQKETTVDFMKISRARTAIAVLSACSVDSCPSYTDGEGSIWKNTPELKSVVGSYFVTNVLSLSRRGKDSRPPPTSLLCPFYVLITSDQDLSEHVASTVASGKVGNVTLDDKQEVSEALMDFLRTGNLP